MAWCGLTLVIVDREEKVHHFWVLESRGAKRKEKKRHKMLQCMVLYCFLPHSTDLQVAFETEQFAVAKRACGELWNHFTQSDSPQQSPETHSSTQTNLSPTG